MKSERQTIGSVETVPNDAVAKDTATICFTKMAKRIHEALGDQ